MPYYDFQCNVCGRPFEVKCSWTELDKVSCPHCESANVRRIYSNIAFVRATPACADGCTSATPSCAPGAST